MIMTQTTLHFSAQQSIKYDFLYQGIPYCATISKKEEVDTVATDYISNYKTRLYAIQFLYLLAENPQTACNIMKLQYILQDSDDTISFLSLLICSSLWLQAL